MNVQVRLVEANDLAKIAEWIELTRKNKDELSCFLEELRDPAIFFQQHYPSRDFCWCWVAELPGIISDPNCCSIVGWIGLQRKSADVGEISRFEIRAPIDLDAKSIARGLFTQAITTARSEGVLQLFLSSLLAADEGLARTLCIEELGFRPLSCLGAGSTVPPFVALRLGDRIIRRVAIVGGTHGNERLGAELIRQWSERQDDQGHCCSDEIRGGRSTFSTRVLLGNPEATATNQRYVDFDLNRLFATTAPSPNEPPLFPLLCSLDAASPVAEERRAVELNRMLGPKGELRAPVGCDFIIDLHSSTSNVGLVAMLSACHEDPFALRLCHHLQQHFPALRIATGAITKSVGWRIESIAPSGILFEVGPVNHGLLSFQLLEDTRRLVTLTLDFVESYNLALLRSGDGDYQIRHFSNKEAALSMGVIKPCAASLLPIYRTVKLYHYPSGSGKYPTTAMIAPAFESQDWQPLIEGQPIFISTDGTGTLIPFSFPHPSVLYPVFINEVAYQRSGIAFIMYRLDQMYLP